jgi:imidazolonepropionase-like amidohydrolase
VNLYNGTDNIKIVASRGFASQALRGSGPPTCAQATVEEMRAAVEEAHKMGRKAMAHANGPQAVKNAVRAGVDTIVHGLHMDEEAAEMMVDAGTVLEPTNICFRPDRYDGSGVAPPQPGTPEYARSTRTKEEFQMIRDKGITISCGTDASVPHFRNGENARELVVCVDLGMTPMEAIISATKTAATTVGLGDQVGTIEKGKLADILIIDGDPLADIGILCMEDNIKYVFKGGQVAISR